MQILVQLAVAIGDGFQLDPDGVAYPLTFAVPRSGRTITLEIDEKCVTTNVVKVVRVALEVSLADELFECVQPGEKAVKYKLPSQGPIDPAIDLFYRTIYREAGSAINFLITCFRVAAHQTWLTDLPTEDDYIGNFFHRVKAATLVVDGRHHNLAPAPYAFTIEGGKHVANAQRLAAVQALASTGRVPLAAELLANAERLWEGPLSCSCSRDRCSNRGHVASLCGATRHDEVEQRAHRTTRIVDGQDRRRSRCPRYRRVLLPLLVPVSLVDDYAMELVIAAIDLRNEVVHNGKRSLDKEHVWDCFIAARELYEGLPMAATDPAPS